MPIPSILGSLYFYRDNISKFIQIIEAIFKRAQILEGLKKLSYILEYYLLLVNILIKEYIKFMNKDYNRMVKKLKTKYIDQDKGQKYYNI